MARSDNICKAHINHITWDNDSLVFYFIKSKGDHKIVNIYEQWHAYSNPFNPFIWSILALTRYVFCNPSVLDGSRKEFESTDPYQHYLKELCRILETNESTFDGMG